MNRSEIPLPNGDHSKEATDFAIFRFHQTGELEISNKRDVSGSLSNAEN